jgi:TolB-like protein/cytochrome c-type biogenesis protein CcmH/NrfG
MSDATKAVFLSYARDDAAAARRIAEALRSAGLEVWFDENELRGGDAWDAKIRKQINDCTLFLPVISQHTQERSKGYFRLEWKLAVEQTHLLAEGVPFLAPVAIDDTREAGAVVPPEFMRVQWTRLPGALPTPQFVEQIKRLLASPADVGRGLPTPPSPRANPIPAESGDPALQSKPRLPAWAWAALAVLLALVGYLALRPAAKEPATPPGPAIEAKPAPAAPQIDAKSIAVLPFVNRSVDKENEFFTDGIHEDILTNLAHIAQLRVVSRTSVMEYRGTTKKIRQIGQELGVAWLLEGSVQRAGNKVRVTGQLINARTDEHVWAQSYDRDLTDVFAIQAELAKEIAGALSATLSPSEKNLLERRPTANPAAYDLYLKARQMNREGTDTRDELEAEVALLQSAVTLDPDFAEGWGRLASTLGQLRFGLFDTTETLHRRARQAIERAQALAPDSLVVLGETGTYYYYVERDYPRALTYLEQFVQRLPNGYGGPFAVALVQRRQGRWQESLANLRRAQQLDPASPEISRNLVISLRALRRYDEAITEQERRVRFFPNSLREAFTLGLLKFAATGATAETDALLAGPLAEQADPAARFGFRRQWAATKGDLATAARLDREHPELSLDPFGAWNAATVLAAQGDLAAARARVQKFPAELRARLATEPDNAAVWMNLALIESLLGRGDEALAAAQKAAALLPESLDALMSNRPRLTMATVLAWNGDKAGACAELARLFTRPGDIGGPINVHDLKNNPSLAPLHGDPRFEAIINDPKNNAPLNP